MKTFYLFVIAIILACVVYSGCNDTTTHVTTPSELVYKSSNETTLSNALLTSFGDEKAIYIDQNKNVTIISKSGDILAQTNLQKAKPIRTYATWETSIPAHNKDTLYARAIFIDDMIYYRYYVWNGRTYGMKPYLISKVGGLKLVDLPCQSGWVRDVDYKLYRSCSGKVKASLSIWKEVVDTEDALVTTVQVQSDY